MLQKSLDFVNISESVISGRLLLSFKSAKYKYPAKISALQLGWGLIFVLGQE